MKNFAELDAKICSCTAALNAKLEGVGGKFKSDYIVSMLLGRNNALIKSYNHHKSEWFGIGAEQDAERAVGYYLLSAEKGYDLAEVAVGQCYASGEGIAKDDKRAFEWFLKAST